MEHTILLENIYKNFDKVFINCTDCLFYTEPTFKSCSELESMIVLNNIATLILLCQSQNNKIHNLTLEMLKCLIHVKCTEFINKNSNSYNNTSENFIKMFFDYLNRLIL